MCCCIAPLVFNLVLTANYFISFDPVREHYKFGTQYQTVYDTHSYSSSRQPSTLIVLENNAYEEYPGIRVFNNLEAMHGKGSVEYTFRRGFLGVRVMTDYVFK